MHILQTAKSSDRLLLTHTATPHAQQTTPAKLSAAEKTKFYRVTDFVFGRLAVASSSGEAIMRLLPNVMGLLPIRAFDLSANATPKGSKRSESALGMCLLRVRCISTWNKMYFYY